MAQRLIGACPACAAALAVERLACTRCGTRVEGRFEPSRFAALSPEQEAFVLAFLRSRGNIRQMERELDISYPTVRSRLEDVLERLGVPVEGARTTGERGEERHRILDLLEAGEISTEEATKRLRDL